MIDGKIQFYFANNPVEAHSMPISRNKHFMIDQIKVDEMNSIQLFAFLRLVCAKKGVKISADPFPIQP